MSPQKKGPFQKEMSSSNHQFSGGYLSFLGEYIYLFISEPKTYESSTNFVCKKIRLCCRVNFTPEKNPAICLGILHMKIPVSPVMATVAMSQIPEPFRNRYVCSLLGEGLKATFPAEVYPKWWWLDHWIIPGLVGGDRITRIYRPVG